MIVAQHVFRSAKSDASDRSLVDGPRWNDGLQFVSGVNGNLLVRDTSDATYGSSWSTGLTYDPAAATLALARGTQTAGAAVSVTATWSGGGTFPGAFLVNITDSGSNAASKLMDLQVSSSSKFSVDKSGNVVAGGGMTAGAVTASGAVTGGTFHGTPGTAPGTPTSGDIYFDSATVQPKFYDGTAFRPFAPSATCHGRLTLSTGVPVSTGDVTGAATLYFTPYVGSRIGVYYNGAWAVVPFAETSISLAGKTASTPYDVFGLWTGTAFGLELLAWTNSTTRATGLAVQDGVYVKSGDPTRRYLGSVFINSTGGQSDDSLTHRYVWNYYNRVPRKLQRLETAGSWTYTTATIRQGNGSTSNQVEVMIGVAEVTVDLTLQVVATNSAGGGWHGQIGLAEDSTTTFQSLIALVDFQSAAYSTLVSRGVFTPAAGKHFYSWNEYSAASGTTTWYGANPVIASSSSGIIGYTRG